MTETLSIKVDKTTKVRLRALAKARKTRPSVLMREALEKLLDGQELRRTKRPSLYDLSKDILAKAGPGPNDLSTNSKYMEDFGR